MENNISKLPTISDREHVRVNGKLYLRWEHFHPTRDTQHDSRGYYIPTFVQEEDDLVGLAIDAFLEKIKRDDPEIKKYFIELQQLLALMKRNAEIDPLRRSQDLFKKLQVNISGSGIAFPSDVAYHAGQLMRLSLFFPSYPFSYISVVAEVVRSEKAEIGYDIKCKYKEISPETREEIVKFVQECQKASS